MRGRKVNFEISRLLYFSIPFPTPARPFSLRIVSFNIRAYNPALYNANIGRCRLKYTAATDLNRVNVCQAACGIIWQETDVHNAMWLRLWCAPIIFDGSTQFQTRSQLIENTMTSCLSTVRATDTYAKFRVETVSGELLLFMNSMLEISCLISLSRPHHYCVNNSIMLFNHDYR